MSKQHATFFSSSKKKNATLLMITIYELHKFNFFYPYYLNYVQQLTKEKKC